MMELPPRYVALVRGINVGRAKRVAMADLRAVVAALGYAEVVTLLNSGNVVFTAPTLRAASAAGARIERAMIDRLGVPARVIVLSAVEVAEMVAKNPLASVAHDPSRMLVTVWRTADDRARLTALTRQAWTPEALAVGRRAAYLWCADGILASRLTIAVGKALGDAATSRNWATMIKLNALANAQH